MSALTLTAFEAEVLEALGDACDQSSIGYVSSKTVMVAGAIRFYPEWGGTGQRRTRDTFCRGTATYPSINLALGRLQRKGLVTRISDHALEQAGYTSGRWWLTDTGSILVGLDA